MPVTTTSPPQTPPPTSPSPSLTSHPPSPSLMADPGPLGRFGRFGGRYVPEALIPACEQLEQGFREAWADPRFRADLSHLLQVYAGRPTPVTPARRLSAELGLTLLLKREDLAHTGSHKINNVLGQALLAQRMGRTRLLAETGAGQHGVATATAGALLGLETVVFMGQRDIERQALNVFRMELLGATVVPVTSGSQTLKDACSEALRHWVVEADTAHYCLGSALGMHPYPWMVREFQRVIGTEARGQCAQLLPAAVPDVVVACVGGGSNAAGTFAGFVDTTARLVGVEAVGGAAVGRGTPGVLHGAHSLLLQDEHGQVLETASISAGLDYPGVGPEHSYLADLGRAEYVTATDAEVVDAVVRLARAEGRSLLVPYVTAGVSADWLDHARAYADAGADALEVGLPFTDPMLDGSVIQRASQRALDRGTVPLEAAAQIGALGLELPLIAMTYLNPVLRQGPEIFCERLRDSGFSALIVVDCPYDEAAPILSASAAHDLELILLVAPSTEAARVGQIAAATRGFLYAAAVMGPTGERSGVLPEAAAVVARVRRVSSVPVLLGFGIANGPDAVAAAAVSDGVVVASALVRRVLAGAGPAAVATEVLKLRVALDEPPSEVHPAQIAWPHDEVAGTG